MKERKRYSLIRPYTHQEKMDLREKVLYYYERELSYSEIDALATELYIAEKDYAKKNKDFTVRVWYHIIEDFLDDLTKRAYQKNPHVRPSDMEINEKTKQTKYRYTKKQLEGVLQDIAEDFDEMLQEALESGALPESWLSDNHFLCNAIVDIWCMKRPYRPKPIFLKLRREIANLARFI